MIEVRHLTYRCRKTAAVCDADFKIRNGHVYGLIGPRGAGKTTVMDLMAGSLVPTEGAVLVNGYDTVKNPMEVKRQIGYMPQPLPLMPDLTAREYLTFVAEMKGVRDEQAERQVRDALTFSGLNEEQNTVIARLSCGQQRRLALIQTTLGNPDIILLDEPTEGLDIAQMRDICALIRRLGERLTVVVSATHIAELGGMCDHVIELSEGRVVADREVEPTPTEEWTDEEVSE